MKMKYKIVCIKEQYIDLAQKYPSFLMAIYQNQDNMYKTKQVELIFSNMSDEKKKFFTLFNHAKIILIIMEYISSQILLQVKKC